MGVYYKILNLDRQEQIDPGNIGHEIKRPERWELPAQMLLMVISSTRPWGGDRVVLVSDADDEDDGRNLYYETKDWPDVGRELLEDMQRYNGLAKKQIERLDANPKPK